MKQIFKELKDWIILAAIMGGLIFGITRAQASEFTYFAKSSKATNSFKSYQFVELQKLADNGEKYNAQEIQTKGRIIRIDKYEGRYGGQYYGLVLAHGITVFSYEDNLKEGVSPDDVIIVDGTFYTFFMYGGTGHDFFIATHHLERLE